MAWVKHPEALAGYKTVGLPEFPIDKSMDLLDPYKGGVTSATQQPAFFAGPVIPPISHNMEDSAPGYPSEIISFLDNAANVHGERSVMYVSFGSIFFAPNLEQTRGLLDAIIACDKPVVYDYGNVHDSMTQILRDGFKKR
jgi:hypothetical protein